MAFLAQVRQSNKCGSARNNEIINLHLESVAGGLFLSQHPLAPARHQPHSLTPSTQTINQDKNKLESQWLES